SPSHGHSGSACRLRIAAAAGSPRGTRRSCRGIGSQAGIWPDYISYRRSLVMPPNAVSTQTNAKCEPLKKLIREVPDFPKKGILFYDITTLLRDKLGFATLIDALSQYYIDKEIDLVLGIEARGFIFGPALAYRLNAGFVPVRKPKKLPGPTAGVTYDLEYGSDTLEIHVDAIEPGQRVVLVDDLLATGGTMEATIKLVQQ